MMEASPKKLERSDNGVGHAATFFADWRRQMEKEVEIHSARAAFDEIKKDKREWSNDEQRREKCDGRRESAFEFAPTVPVV